MATADFPRNVAPTPNGAQSPEHSNQLGRTLQNLAARRNQRALWSSISRALVWGVGAAALLVLLHKFYIVDAPFWAPVALILAALVFGIRNGLLHRAGPFEAALDADRVLGLDERLSSALAFTQPETVRRARHEYSGDGVANRIKNALFPRVQFQTAHVSAATAMVPALVNDAATRAASLDPRQVYPFAFDKTSKILTGAVIALLAFSLMPNMDFFRSPEQKALAGVLDREGKELEAVAKSVQKDQKLEEEARAKKLARRLEALGQKMQRGRMSKKEALLSLGELRQELERQPNESRQEGGGTNWEQLEQQIQQEEMQTPEARQLQNELQNKQVEKAAEQLEKLAERLEKGNMTPEEKEKAAQDLEKMARALRQSGNEDAAKKLEDAAKQLREQNKQQNQGQNQQGQKQQGQQNGQDQSSTQKNQQGKQGQQQNGQQGQNQKNQNGQQGQQKNQQGQSGQQSQQGQQNQQGQKQNQQGQQSQSGQSQQGQQQQQQGQQGGQSQSGGQNQQSGGQQSQGSGSGALRNLAKDLRSSGSSQGNSQAMRDMLNKIQEAERDTGQNSGQQQGNEGQGKQGQQGQNGQSGQGNQAQPGKNLQVTDPKGQVGGGAGLGPRNNAQSVGKGGGVSQFNSSKRTGDKRRWGDVWSDRLPKTQKNMSRIQGKMGENGEMEQLRTRTEAKGGPVKTPYYDVYESYKKDAEDAVSREAVPPAYREPVKNYFDSIKPQ